MLVNIDHDGLLFLKEKKIKNLNQMKIELELLYKEPSPGYKSKYRRQMRELEEKVEALENEITELLILSFNRESDIVDVEFENLDENMLIMQKINSTLRIHNCLSQSLDVLNDKLSELLIMNFTHVRLKETFNFHISLGPNNDNYNISHVKGNDFIDLKRV